MSLGEVKMNHQQFVHLKNSIDALTSAIKQHTVRMDQLVTIVKESPYVGEEPDGSS